MNKNAPGFEHTTSCITWTNLVFVKVPLFFQALDWPHQLELDHTVLQAPQVLDLLLEKVQLETKNLFMEQ